MIHRLQRLNQRQRQLVLSLLANFTTRVPGLIGVLFFLPHLKARIGLNAFALLMTAMTLGGSATFVMGGVSYVARRLVGDAFSRGDRTAEADAVRSVFDVSIAAVALCSLVVVGYGLLRGSPLVFHVAALLTALMVLVQQQDAVRAAYNEHYITAMIQVVLQSIAYGITLLFLPEWAFSVLLGVAVIQGTPLISSCLSLIGMLRRRPYLLYGRHHLRRTVARQGLMMGAGEGLLMASLGFAVLFLDSMHAVAESAWYATTLRLFSIVLVPVVLILLPLSSYVRLIWNDCSLQRRQTIILGTLVVSLAYSLVVGASMVILSRLYVGKAMHIVEPGTHIQTLAIFGMFAAVVVFKSYTSIAFVVIESRWLSISAVVGTLAAIAAGAAAAPWSNPIGAVAVFSAALTLAIVTITAIDAGRYHKSISAATAAARIDNEALDPAG